LTIDECPLLRFYKDALPLNARERGLYLSTFSPIQNIHNKIAEINRSPDALEDEVEFHYVSLISSNNTLVELDGCKGGPVDCGSTSDATFATDAFQYLKKNYFKTTDVRFCLMAIAPIEI
jgi:hypothetical protein